MTTNKYEIIFNNAPIGIWEEDWSGVKSILDSLRGVVPIDEFKEYINQNSSLIKQLADSIKITRANKKAIEMHEADSLEDLINTPIITTFSESSRETFKKEMIALYSGHKTFEMETEIITLKHNAIHVIMKIEFPDDDSYENVILVMTDITQNKITSDKYIESKAKFNKSFYHGVVGMIIFNINGKIIETNNAFCELTKYSFPELQDTTIYQIMEEPNIIQEELNALISNCQNDCSIKGEKQIIDKMQNKIWVYMGISLVKDENGNSLYFVGQIVDIDSEKKTSLTLEDNVHKYQQLLDSTNAIYLILNTDSNINECSESFIDLLGFGNTAQGVNKVPLRALVSTESIPAYDIAWKKIMAGETVTNIEISLTKYSAFKWVSMNASLFNNGCKKVFVLLTDISSKKRKEMEHLIQKEKHRDKLRNNIRDLRKTIAHYGETKNGI
jgi:PAS domain S-box-containing protein